MLSHVSSLRLSSGHSGQVLTLSMQPTPPCPAPACWWWRPASGLLLCWELQFGAYSVVFFFFFFSSPGYVVLWDSKTPHRPSGERVSCYLETSPLWWLPPQDGSLSLTLLPLFLSFIFCPTSFQREWVAFWVPGVLHQHSEVVLWKSFSIQMIFWWICWGESGLPIVFLCYLRTASDISVLNVGQLFSSRGSLVPLHFLPLGWCHLHIWGCWYFSQKSWFQLVIHPAWHFTWCTLHII